MSRKRLSSIRSSVSARSFLAPSEESIATNESDDSEDIPLKRLKGVDSYCWLCHKPFTNQSCITCIRSYHNECIGLKINEHLNRAYKCELCQTIKSARNDYKKR